MSYFQQNRGVAGYEQSGDWTWEMYPPPYDFLAPRDSAPQPAPIMRGRNISWGLSAYEAQAFATPQVLVAPMRNADILIPDWGGRVALPAPVLLTPTKGLSGCGCGCKGKPGGCGGGDGHSHGLGLFESGFDYTQWNAQEWVFVGVGGYLAMSILGDLMSVGRGVKKGGQKVARGYRRVKGVVTRQKPAYEPS